MTSSKDKGTLLVQNSMSASGAWWHVLYGFQFADHGIVMIEVEKRQRKNTILERAMVCPMVILKERSINKLQP